MKVIAVVFIIFTIYFFWDSHLRFFGNWQKSLCVKEYDKTGNHEDDDENDDVLMFILRRFSRNFNHFRQRQSESEMLFK